MNRYKCSVLFYINDIQKVGSYITFIIFCMCIYLNFNVKATSELRLTSLLYTAPGIYYIRLGFKEKVILIKGLLLKVLTSNNEITSNNVTTFILSKLGNIVVRAESFVESYYWYIAVIYM